MGIDPLARRATTVYDPAGRAIVEINANGGRLTTTYDAAGRRIGLRDPRGYRMSFTYDAAGQATSEVNAVGSRTTFTYDANSQRVGRLDPRGIPTTWTYDAANRMRSRRQPGGQIVTWTHDPAGNLVQLETPLGRYTRTFDPADNVTLMTTPEEQTLQWVRDPMGRRKVLIDPDGGRTTYTCNGLGQVTKLVNAHLERTTTTYDPAGRETRLELDNGTVTTTIYEAAGQTIRVAHVGFEHFDYTYDAAGRRTRLVESTGDRVTWTYDPTGQLTSESRSGANAYATTYAYDPSGNRLVEITETNRTTSVYDGFNRLLKSDSLSGITTYSYDPAGNRTRLEDPSGDLTTYTWNAENHLVQTELPSGEIVTTVWDPINKNAEERIVRRDDGTTVTHYLWDNNNILRETDDVGATEADYTYIPQPYGDLVSQRRESESHFYQFDALGSTTGLTDETGAVTDEYRYKAFGETVAQTGATENPCQWVARVGYRKDEATGDYCLRERILPPRTGQFLSADPKGLDAGDSNFYRYVGNDPIRTTDPSGLEPTSSESKCAATVPSTCQAEVTKEAIDNALKALGLSDMADLLTIPKRNINSLWQDAGARGECCRIEIGADKPWGQACRIKVPLSCGRYQHLWVVLLPPEWFGEAKLHIVGSDDGSAESFEATCESLHKEAVRQQGVTFWNRFNNVPLVGTAKLTCEGDYGNAALSAVADATIVLGGLGAYYKSARVLRAATAVATAGAAGHGGRGLINLYSGKFDQAALDTLAALLFLWGAKTTNDLSKLLAKKPAGAGIVPKTFPTRPGGTGPAYNAATGQGVYVLRNPRTGQIEYVGRGDAPQRLLEHAKPGSGKEDLVGEILFNNNLTAAQAQSLENELMQILGGPKSINPSTSLRNKIQGIGECNPNFLQLEFAADDELVIEALRRAGLLKE